MNREDESKWTKLKEKLESRAIEKAPDSSYWVIVPQEPATFGHLLVISWKGCADQDITDEGLFRDSKHMQETMTVIHNLALEMKDSLTSNGEADGKRCKKVYLISECEKKDFPFHFHLIPRFECQRTGHFYLFEKELEEARWLLNESQEEVKINDGCQRIGEAQSLLLYHRWLILSNRWTRSNGEREKYIDRMKKWWVEHWDTQKQSTRQRGK